MSSIWIILLDTSGSMSDGFTVSSATNQDPLGESGAWATKLDAAKDLLLRQVSSLRSQDIAVFRFTSSCQKLFQGAKDDLLRRPDLVQSLTAGGDTNIAAALNEVSEDNTFEQYRSLSVVVLTDGLSEQEDASKAAEALVEKYPFARIDTILIDETKEGRDVAEAISINGTVRTATSSVQLRSAITGARVDSLRGELSSMAAQRFYVQRELSTVQLLAPPTLITVNSNYSLTASTLRNDVAPTLAGIEAIGQAVSYISGSEYRGTVSSISQDSPISINLTGLRETVELVLAYVIPWRRQNAERLSSLEVRKAEIEVERNERDLSAHAFEIEQRRLENLRIELELAKSKWDLAERMIRDLDPDSNLRGEARHEAFARLLSGIEQLGSTRMEFEVVREITRQ